MDKENNKDAFNCTKKITKELKYNSLSVYDIVYYYYIVFKFIDLIICKNKLKKYKQIHSLYVKIYFVVYLFIYYVQNLLI